jgi:hypothetical protein
MKFNIGDSGSPLIQYFDGRATAIVIVRTGGLPSSSNPTTVYTQIWKYLKWIENTIFLTE